MVVTLEREKSDSDKQVELLKREKESFKVQEEKLIAQFQQEMNEKSQRMENLKTSYEKQIDLLKEQISDRDRVVDRMKERGEKIHDELEKRVTQANDKVKAMQQQLEDYKSHNSGQVHLSDEFIKLKAHHKETEQDLKNKEAELIVLTQHVEDGENIINGLKTENGQLKQKLLIVETDLVTVTTDFNSLKKNNSEIEIRYEHLLNTNVQLKSNLEEMTTKSNAKPESVPIKGDLGGLVTVVEQNEDDLLEQELFEEILDKIKKNDKDLIDVVLTDGFYKDSHVEKVCQALMKNTNVLKLDFSENKGIVGQSEDAICKLLLTTTTLNELMFTSCPIQHNKLLLIKECVKMNQSLVQCTLGLFETKKDVDEIEEAMNHNFERIYHN